MVYTLRQGSSQSPWPKSLCTGHSLASHIHEKLTIYGQIPPSMLRAIIKLFFKGHKCRTIQMNVLDYKGLKSKTVKNNKLEVSRTIKPLTMCMMHASQQSLKGGSKQFPVLSKT